MPVMILLCLLLTGLALATRGVPFGSIDGPRGRPLQCAIMGCAQVAVASRCSRTTPGLRPLAVLSGLPARFSSRRG